ncbi:hypothetical protein SAY86_017333 [Trapa natans]|uniref:Bifunctional inhibitor/plant lipid transfer protein/seed storage helical domain-containing protein n=1 Tax=Trapa natans TaxID=22666 RepID=A0AAN7LR50_TRANT|nr:hypothetical protein SAY86_017333 [Trapa natans]
MEKTTRLLCIFATILALSSSHKVSSLDTPALAPGPAARASCDDVIYDMLDCVTYISAWGSSNHPSASCCSGVKSVMDFDGKCICVAIKSSAQLGIQINMTRVEELPSLCKLKPYPLGECDSSGAPEPSPDLAFSPPYGIEASLYPIRPITVSLIKRYVPPDWTAVHGLTKLNDLLSLGQHRVWKRMSVSWSGAKVGDRVLDLCCGSGDLAFLLSEKVGSDGKVFGLDFSKEQLLIASSRQHLHVKRHFNNIEWVEGNAINLPFPDSFFDAITMGYGLRNVVDRERALMEMVRVLKSGSGCAQPENIQI